MTTKASDAMAEAGVLDGPDGAVNEILREARFVDHHVHSIIPGRVDEAGLVAGLSESDRPAAAAAAGIDHQLGIAVRRWCAPLLGSPSPVDAATWLPWRARIEGSDAGAVLLPLAGLEALYVDTGFRTADLLPVAALGHLAGAEARPVVRLETLAEEVARSGVEAAGFAAAYRHALAHASRDAVGLKSIVAYRAGLDLEPTEPTAQAVTEHAGRWLAAIDAGEPVRLSDPVLLRSVLWSGVATGLPLQIHTGLGDTDLDLRRADPLHLTGFIRATAGRTRILLLHTYPYHRQAGYLAQMFEHVFMDVGLAVNHSGIASELLVAESLEVTPLRKVLYSSDAWGLPELHLLGSWLFRRALGRVLGRWVAAGDWSIDDVDRAVALIGRDNALEAYRA